VGKAPAIVVMGVAGGGKSTAGALLAKLLGAAFIEGDRFHLPQSIEKMSAGIALTDEDRWPWLERVGQEIARLSEAGKPVVCACSALKRSYRDALRESSGLPLTFVYLQGSRELIAGRMQNRTGHFFAPSLLDSQFATLEPPGKDENAVVADLRLPLEEMVERVMAELMHRKPELDDWIEDAELNRIADARAGQPDIDVDLDDD
jgi:gluconokinase